jgi:hypothetical protein
MTLFVSTSSPVFHFGVSTSSHFELTESIIHAELMQRRQSEAPIARVRFHLEPACA